MLSPAEQPPRTQTDLQNLIVKKSRYLHKLQEQQAVLGIHTPPHILIQIEDLQHELADLKEELKAVKVGANTWQALVIDADDYWREIIDSHISRLGGAVLEHPAFPSRADQGIIDTCDLAIVSPKIEPASRQTIKQWIKNVVKLGRQLPIILLASREDRDVAVALRQAFRQQDPPIRVTTIFKDNFDADWFAKIIQHKLARRKALSIE